VRILLWIVLAGLTGACRAAPTPASFGSGDAGLDGGDDAADAATVTAAIAPPRPVAPISVSHLTSRRPTFRWALAPGSDGARVEVCADRACTRLVASFDASGDHGAPPDELPSGVVFWRLRGTSRGAVGVATSITWEAVSPARSAPVATAWGAMLDANGDGLADVVVGDSDELRPTQHVFVHLGGATGPAVAPSGVLSAPMPVIGYATSVASADDIDGDGFGDLLVGSPQENTVYVYRGGVGGFAEPPAWVLHGAAMSQFGAAVNGTGDVDGDGYGDIVVGMPSSTVGDGSAASGAAMVFYGGPTGPSADRTAALARRAGSDAQDFGYFVAGAGDVDGDGRSDVAVFGGIESTDPQFVALYLGRDQPFGAAPSRLLQYEGSNVVWMDNAHLLACAGDDNGDGYTDLVMSTSAPQTIPYEPDHLSLFYGGPTGPGETLSRRLVSPLAPRDAFGVSVAAIDFDGDGLDDIAAGVNAYQPPAISAFVYLGAPSGPGAATDIATTDTRTAAEREVTSPGDIDGDGFADLVIAYPARVTVEDGGALRGAVEVHRGGPSGVAAAAQWTLLPPDTKAVAYGGSLAPP